MVLQKDVTDALVGSTRIFMKKKKRNETTKHMKSKKKKKKQFNFLKQLIMKVVLENLNLRGIIEGQVNRE